MRRAKYPEDAVQSYTVFLRNENLPLLGPCTTPAYPSWMNDDHTPVEFSLILREASKSLVWFTFEPSTLPLAGDRSITTLRRTLERLSFHLEMQPQFDLEWFDICAEELLLAETQGSNCAQYFGFNFLKGLDCAHHSAIAKVYFMPRIRTLVSNETSVELLQRMTYRMDLVTPWEKISCFLARFLPGDRPEIEIVAVDCVPCAQNRLKIYFRTDILSYTHMKYFLTLGRSLSATGLRNAQLMWSAITQVTGEADSASPTQAPYFPSGLIYYELKQDDDSPSAEVYLPVRRYLPNDLGSIRLPIERLFSSLSGSSIPNDYPDFIQTVFSHRDLSIRTGIHTYVACTVKPGGSDISVYYSPEAFAS
ncbi:aromatic prenyltransferase [Mycena rosella]|uniref:Aromatic prenyltransferase n=1 Tax=Mycena rosella TaxID=1033263 RepID=A0AAD7C6C0_MYCRO|nr:aromatic prenyltransferase [Mycena rosella]